MTPPERERRRRSLIALIALSLGCSARISNLIVGHTGIWGSRDQLSIVFALRNELEIFWGTEEDFAVPFQEVFLAEKRCKMTQDFHRGLWS